MFSKPTRNHITIILEQIGAVGVVLITGAFSLVFDLVAELRRGVSLSELLRYSAAGRITPSRAASAGFHTQPQAVYFMQGTALLSCRQHGGIFTAKKEYIHMIHQYKLGEYNIVLDVCSGSVHAVDEVAYDIIAMFENNDRATVTAAMREKYADRADITDADIEECYDQVVELKNAGKLFAPDTFKPMAGKLKEKTAGVVKALCLHIATPAISTALIALPARANITASAP
jgi:hypothetical protein